MPARLTEIAKQDVADYADVIATDSVTRAVRWTDGLFDLVDLIGDSPLAFARIPEDDRYRAAHYFSHRLIYRILEDDLVVVVRVVHAAQKPIEVATLDQALFAEAEVLEDSA